MLQSPEGRKRLIAMQKIEEQAKIVYADTAKEIIAKNKTPNTNNKTPNITMSIISS